MYNPTWSCSKYSFSFNTNSQFSSTWILCPLTITSIYFFLASHSIVVPYFGSWECGKSRDLCCTAWIICRCSQLLRVILLDCAKYGHDRMDFHPVMRPAFCFRHSGDCDCPLLTRSTYATRPLWMPRTCTLPHQIWNWQQYLVNLDIHFQTYIYISLFGYGLWLGPHNGRCRLLAPSIKGISYILDPTVCLLWCEITLCRGVGRLTFTCWLNKNLNYSTWTKFMYYLLHLASLVSWLEAWPKTLYTSRMLTLRTAKPELHVYIRQNVQPAVQKIQENITLTDNLRNWRNRLLHVKNRIKCSIGALWPLLWLEE